MLHFPKSPGISPALRAFFVGADPDLITVTIPIDGAPKKFARLLGTPYQAWMSGFISVAGDDRLPAADPDDDGISNLLEWVLDGNPGSADPSILPAGAMDGDDLTFIFNRRDDTEGPVAQVVQHGTDLIHWTDMPIGNASGATYAVDELGGAPDRITVTIPATGGPKAFARLQVMEVP